MKSILMRSRLFIVLATCIALSGAAVLAKGHSDAKFCKFRDHTLILKGGEPALSRETCKPLFFVFVNNQSPAGGNGTFESPYNTLAAAQINSSPGDIIYVLVGDGSDMGQNAGIILQYGQQLLGAGICQSLKTKEGKVTIPAQSPAGLPTISNTNVTDVTGLAAVRLRDGHNVVSGFNLVDTQGVVVAFGPGMIQISSALQVDTGMQYVIKNNTLSTPSFAAADANAMNILGGGCMKISNNTYICGNTNDVFGAYVTNGTSLLQGNIEFKHNVFTGMDNNSGFVTGIHYDSSNNGQGIFVQTTSSVSIIENIFASQSNTTPFDNASAILFNSASAPFNTLTFTITGNIMTIPLNSPTAQADLVVNAFGLGTTLVKVNKNVATNSYGLPGYLFANLSSPFSASALKVCFSSDNVGTREDLIEAGKEFRLGGSKGRHFRSARQ